jgi:hypothetical protein
MEVDGVKRLLDAATEDADMAMAQFNVGKHLIEEAIVKVNIVREISVDPLGLPQLHTMLAKVEELESLNARFKDATSRYRNIL